MICPVWRRIINDNEFDLVRPFTGVCKPAVKVGDKVEADSVVAHCEVSAGQRLVKVAQVLGIGRHEVKKHLLRNLGDRIYQGEIIARKRSLFGKSELRSPADGIITDINQNGDIVIKFLPTPVKLVAGSAGEITSVKEDSVVVRTFGNEIKGAAGLGKSREGILKIVAKPHEFIIPQTIDASCQGRVIVGGALLERAAIEKALTLGVRGIVVGGINYRDFLSLGLASDVGITIVITEGFGAVSMGKDIFKRLGELDDHFSFISGQERTLIVPEDASGRTSKPINFLGWRELKVEDNVRYFRRNSEELVGKVESIAEKDEELENGLSTVLATVKFTSGAKIAVPASNLEIVE